MEYDNWAYYDTSEFPLVKVKLHKNIKDDDDFEDFLKGWLSIYNLEQPFVFIFDYSEVDWVNPKYAYKMLNFVKELWKKKYRGEEELLRKSYIFYDNWYDNFLLKFIFLLQQPLSPVEIIHISEMEDYKNNIITI